MSTFRGSIDEIIRAVEERLEAGVGKNDSRLLEQLKQVRDEVAASRKQLDHLEQLLYEFLNHNPALSFIKDEQGKYLYVSKSFGEFFNVSVNEVIGKTDYEWLPPEVAQQFTKNDEEVRSIGKPVEIIESVPLPHGTIHSIVHKFPIVTPAGRTLVGGIAIDITRRRAAEELSSQLSAVVESSHDAIIAETLDGIIASWNRGAEAIYGYSKQEVVGKPTSILVPQDSHDDILAAIRASRLGDKIENFETVGLRKDGQRLYVSLTVSPIHNSDGMIVGASIIARDVTSRKQAEKEVSQLNKQLELQVSQLAEMNTKLERARDEALEAARVKSAIVANVSHELRTPLSAILGMNELLLDTSLSSEQTELAHTVQGSAKTLLSLVNDILDLVSIEADKLSVACKEFDLEECVRESVQILRGAATHKSLDISVEIDPSIPKDLLGDPQRIGQVLLNLIGNAIKFTNAGNISVIAERISSTDQTCTVRFQIRDTGIGIPTDQMKLLFQPFSQLDSSRTRKYGGTGLGLSISKSILELMGGSIGVDSAVGDGSTFWFTLPLDRPRSSRSP